MKNIILFFAFIISFTSCIKENKEGLIESSESETELRSTRHIGDALGKVIDGEYVLTVDLDDLISNWNRALTENSIPTIDHLELLVQDGGEVVLLGTSSSNGASSAIELTVDGDEIYELGTVGGGGLTCTCSGCTSTGPQSAKECIANAGKKTCWCSACDAKDCVKTTTTTSGTVLSN